MIVQIEADKAPECCETCIYLERDDWYPSEFICDCGWSHEYGKTKSMTESCQCWEGKEE